MKPAHTRNGTRPRVLVIDDDRVIRMVVRDALGQAGIDVQEAADATSGLVLARRIEPQLIILDVMLPRVDGLALLGDLRACGIGSKVLVFSATGARNADRALRLGADAYLNKPFELQELVSCVQSLLVSGTPGETAQPPSSTGASLASDDMNLSRTVKPTRS